jgi:prepilin peptidase CpaA
MSQTVFAASPLGVPAALAFASLLAAGCASDLRSRRIPNRLVLVMAVTGLVYSVTAAPWLTGFAQALGGLGVGLAIWFPFYLARMLGAGDVKFFAAAAVWLGPLIALKAALLSGVFGGVLALVWMLWDNGWVVTLARVSSMAEDAQQSVLKKPQVVPSSRRLPYGIAMAAGLAVAAWFPSLLG